MQDRSYILVLPLIFTLSLGLSIGLTYLPCYSGLCVEAFFPFTARMHIATFYGLIASVALALTARAASDKVRAISELYVVRSTVPILGKRISLGAMLFAVWVVGLWIATTAFWWPTQQEFYQARGLAVEWTAGTVQLAVTAVIGHHADLAVGFMILPVARNTFLGRAFGLHQSTLLTCHKLLGYVALVAVVAHGVTYFTWMPKVAHIEEGPKKDAFWIDNPTITAEEAEATPWKSIVLISGVVALLCFLVIVVTSLPKQRRVRYNVFYYTHVILGSFFFFLVCVHASTDFYFLLPGLILWLVDWATRLRWLRKNTVTARLENAGHGWYRIRLPSPLGTESCEKAVKKPLQAYYLNFPTVSKLQCHAFTASAVGGVDCGPTFLFRRAEGKKEKKLGKEWTWKLGSLVESASSAPEDVALPSMTLPLRVEGPYETPSEPLFVASRVLCLVGGTGITGALSLADTWLHHRAREEGARFRILWTVRTQEAARVAEVDALREQMATLSSNMDVVVYVSREAGRLEPAAELASFFESAEAPVPVRRPVAECGDSDQVVDGKAAEKVPTTAVMKKLPSGWVYCSGPAGLLHVTDVACLNLDRSLRIRSKSQDFGLTRLDRYCAKWEV